MSEKMTDAAADREEEANVDVYVLWFGVPRLYNRVKQRFVEIFGMLEGYETWVQGRVISIRLEG